MVGCGFDGLDGKRIVLAKISIECIQLCNGSCGERRDFGDVNLSAERFEPFDFNHYTIANQPEFAEVAAQGINFSMVASVQRGEGGEFGERGHG